MFSFQKLSGSKIELKFVVSAEDFAKFRKEAVFNLGKEMKMEGFRQGHIPEEIIEKKLGEENILAEAIELAIQESYKKAIRQLAEENKIEPLGKAEVEILRKPEQGKILEFKVQVSVFPEIKLPDYEKIAKTVEKKEISVSENEVEASLTWLQKTRAKFSLKSGPAQKGDFVELEYSSPQLEVGKTFQDAFILGEGRFVQGFEENLEGMSSGEEKEFSLKFPESHPQKNLAGKEINFKTKIKSVQKMELAEINDQFAKSLGNFENLVALKQSIKEGLNSEKEKDEEQRVCQEILDKVSQETVCEIPEVLIESEKNRILEDLKRQVLQGLQIPFEDYLKKINKSEKELLDSFSEQAKNGVKNSLVLREIGKKENIEASAQELEEEINKILKQYPDIKKAQEGFDSEKLKEYTEEVIRNRKTLKLLENFIKL